MNVYEYMDRAKAFAVRHSEQRIGQAMMNYLFQVSPIAYNNIPEDVDPFYNDELVKDFIKFLLMNWDKLTRPIHTEY